jgi:host factor-I protein
MDRRSQHTASQKRVPPESTGAEGFYYIKQKDSKTPIVVRLLSGEHIRGVIEWYDKHCLKLRQLDASELVIMKHNIKCIYKLNK